MTLKRHGLPSRASLDNQVRFRNGSTDACLYFANSFALQSVPICESSADGTRSSFFILPLLYEFVNYGVEAIVPLISHADYTDQHESGCVQRTEARMHARRTLQPSRSSARLPGHSRIRAKRLLGPSHGIARIADCRCDSGARIQESAH